MALVFWLTFNVIGAWLQGLLEQFIGWLTELADAGMTAWNVNDALHSLIINGIFNGVGSVLSFLPIIVTLFFFLSLLEDTGYMARVAFVMDKLLRKIGLSGRSIVPMLVGFGCSVPGVMASRTLPSERDRKMTIILIPFMSCTAKLPIYGFFTAAFFPEYSGLIMVALYFGGIAVGILVAMIAKNSIFKGDAVPFVMELPNYRMPGAKNVLQLLWDKAKDFLQRAFTVILFGTTTALTSLISTKAAAALLVFCLLYTPCIAAIASIRRELGQKWAIGVVILQCAIAWVCAFVMYHLLMFL